MKTVPDSDAIKSFLAEHQPKTAIIIGGAFIGLETVEALLKRGLDVTVVDIAPHILPTFDPEMAALLADHLKEKGVQIVVGDGIQAFHEKNGLALEAELQSGRRLSMDLAILSIGVRPE